MAQSAPGDSTIRALKLTPPVNAFSPRRVTSPYGERDNPRGEGRGFHEGIDIQTDRAEEIVAAGPGTVIYSGRERGFGNVVIIDHGAGVTTLYAHLFYACVRKGERVKSHSLIGRAGKRGSTTGTHLHFEIRRDGKPVDPLTHLWLDSAAPEP